jgi:ATP-binding cassette subfamily B protein
MPLIEPLPKPLEAALKDKIAAGKVQVAVPTDLTLQGDFGEEWLIITDDILRVYSSPAAPPRLELRLSAIKSPAVDSLIGGGALLMTVHGKTQEVLRFTNFHQRTFSRVVKYMADVVKYHDDLSAGREVKKRPTIEPDPEERKRCPHCHLFLREGTRVCPACLNKGKVILRLIKLTRPYLRQTVFVWVMMLLGMVLNLVPPYLTRPLMDRVLAPTRQIASVSERIALLGWLVLALFAALAAVQIVGIIRERLVVKIGARISHDLRVRLFSHLQFLSLKFFDKRSVGSIIARVIQDSQSLENVLVEGMQHFIINILTLLGIGTVLGVMNWKLTLLVLVPVPAVIILSHVFWKRILSLWHRFWHYRSRLTASVSDTLSGLRVVKAFAKENEEIERFRGYSHNVLASGMIAEQMWATFFPLLWFIASLGTLFVWYFGGRMVLGGTMTLGTLMTFIAYLAMFYGPLRFLSRIADYLARSLTSAERVFEILDSDTDVAEAKDALAMPCLTGHVEFKAATFGYEAHKSVLKNINLDVKPGEMIGLVGHSGAGKTTTINLICRFYDVNEGEICMDGINIRKIKQQHLRSQIGVVLQDTFLFNGSIAENISYAMPKASPEDIMAAAKTANAHDFITAKPDGYDTKVGERGQSLSAGERQRIAIARAILHNPRILILDEATASVDTDTEKQIQEAIVRLVKGRTTFAIAHRLSTLRNADRLLVLKNGEIIETGTHEELLEKKGEFYRLVNTQQEISKVMEVGI